MGSRKSDKNSWRLTILRIALGVLMLWFGLLKFLGPPGISDNLAIRTVAAISFGHISPEISLFLIAALECIIGLGLFSKKLLRYILPLLFLHILGTALPLILFPSETWKGWLAPTFEGQYIIKNLLIAASAVVLSAIPFHDKIETS